MTLKFKYLLIIILLCCIGQMQGQVAKTSNADTIKTAHDKDLINEYFQRQRNLALQFEDTLTQTKPQDTAIVDEGAKSKFIILCFNLSKSYEEEIFSLNKIAKEYEKYLSSIVIKADDLNKYKEIFNNKEFKSLQNFINNKSAAQKRATSFPVILVLDKRGQILHAWSGDKTEDGLKKEDYYAKIKAGLGTIHRQK